MTLILTIFGLLLTGALNAFLHWFFGGETFTYWGISFIIIWIWLYNTCLVKPFDKFTFNIWQLLFFVSIMLSI